MWILPEQYTLSDHIPDQKLVPIAMVSAKNDGCLPAAWQNALRKNLSRIATPTTHVLDQYL